MSQKPSLAFVKLAPHLLNVVCSNVGSAGTRDTPALHCRSGTKRSKAALVKSTASAVENFAWSNDVLAPLNVVFVKLASPVNIASLKLACPLNVAILKLASPVNIARRKSAAPVNVASLKLAFLVNIAR